MMRAASVFAGIASVARVAALGAQDVSTAPLERPQVFLERSYFAPLSPTGKHMLFEGYASGHYFFKDGLSDRVWQANGGMTWAVPVSMVFLVRMTRDFSSPVRTPSYQIRPLYLQLFQLARDDDRVSYWLVGEGVGLTHYSNGQAGCTYQGFVVNAKGDDCVVGDATLAPLAARRIANTFNGSFSTDFIPLNVNLRRGRARSPNAPLDWQTTVGAELQIHPYGGLPGALDRLQAETYGQHQFSVRAEYEKRLGDFASKWVGVWRIAGDYTRRFGGGASSPPTFGFIETSYVFDNAGSAGGFLRVNGGRDYYNIHYQESGRFAAFGVKWDLGRVDVLQTKPRPR